MEDFTFLKLTCKDCDNVNCEIPLWGKLHFGSEIGCTRKVSLEDHDKYIHYTKEIPRNLLCKNNLYNEIIIFLDKIYQQPLGKLIDKKGKTIEPL